MLDSNPSYLQLCEALEQKGVNINSAAFARELLQAVPYGGGRRKGPAASNRSHPSKYGATAPPQRSTPVGLRSPPRDRQQNATVAYEAPKYVSLREATNEVNSMAYAPQQLVRPFDAPGQQGQYCDYSSPYFPTSQAAPNGSRPPSQSQPPPPQSSEPPQKREPSPPRPPANKEEAARKRTFGDLVDLTMEDSDEEAPPKKIAQIGVNTASVVPPDPRQQTEVDKTRDSGISKAFALTTYGATKSPRAGQGPIHLSVPASHPPGSAKASLEKQRRLAGVPEYLKKHALPLVGAAPSEVPSKPKGPSLEHMQRERIKGKPLVEPIMRDCVARRSTYDHRSIARAVLLATCRHPDMRGLNGHLASMQKLLGEQDGMIVSGGNRADLATIRWDSLDPSAPKPVAPKPANSKPFDVNVSVVDGDGEEADGEGGFIVPSPKALSRPQPVSGDASHVTDIEAGPPTLTTYAHGITKSGRYKKHPGRKPLASLPASTNKTTKGRVSPSTSPDTLPRKAAKDGTSASSAPGGTSANDMAASGTPVGYAAFRQLDANGNPIKKKGRPVGWRKDVHSRQAAGLTPAKPGGHLSAGFTGGRGKRTSTSKEEPIPEPHYEIFNCMWQDCNAELHNLDVLKKHVTKVHGKRNGQDIFNCLWQDCHHSSKHVTSQSKTKASAPASFSDVADWVKHVDRAHLQEVAWKLGDGPKGGLSGKFCYHYLLSTMLPYILMDHLLTDKSRESRL